MESLRYKRQINVISPHGQKKYLIHQFLLWDVAVWVVLCLYT